MWLISKHAFVSVVRHNNKAGAVLIRARDIKDLQSLGEIAEENSVPGFSSSAILETPDADYRFRIVESKENWVRLAGVIAGQIDYGNFKDAVADISPERAEIYGQVWSDLMKIQYPNSESWSDRAVNEKSETVSRLYRMAADHLKRCFDEFKGDTPIPEDSIGSALDPPLLPENLGYDPVAILEERMVQRIAIGFWEQAEGDGFERLDAAITAAERAADLRLADSDRVSIEDELLERERAPAGLPDLIPNASLHLKQVPTFYLGGLDPAGFNCGVIDPDLGDSTTEWKELWTFALTFDGYQYFGGDEGSPERLGLFAKSVEQSFQENGHLPALDLAMLRACLFLQQRHWLKWGGVMTRSCPPGTVEYLDALLRAIRSKL